MKHLLITTLIVVVYNSNIWAQDTLRHKNRTSLSIGVSLTKDLSFDTNYNDSRSMFSPNFKFRHSTNIRKQLWFTTGIGYHQIGDIYDYYIGINREKTDIKIYLNTLRVPMLFSIEYDEGSKVNPFLSFGPSLNFTLFKPTINAKDRLNDPDRFRRNVPQGYVVRRQFLLMDLSLGLNFKNKNKEVSYYIMLPYNGNLENVFMSTNFNDPSKYLLFSLNVGLVIPKN